MGHYLFLFDFLKKFPLFSAQDSQRLRLCEQFHGQLSGRVHFHEKPVVVGHRRRRSLRYLLSDASRRGQDSQTAISLAKCRHVFQGEPQFHMYIYHKFSLMTMMMICLEGLWMLRSWTSTTVFLSNFKRISTVHYNNCFLFWFFSGWTGTEAHRQELCESDDDLSIRFRHSLRIRMDQFCQTHGKGHRRYASPLLSYPPSQKIVLVNSSKHNLISSMVSLLRFLIVQDRIFSKNFRLQF